MSLITLWRNSTQVMAGLSDGWWLTVSAAVLTCLVGALVWLAMIRQHVARLRRELRQSRRLLERIRPSRGLEENFNLFLEALSEIVDAPYYAFYTLDDRNGRFTLRAVRHPSDDFAHIGPSYSGLALPKKDAYLPPVTIRREEAPYRMTIKPDGEMPLLVIPTENQRCLIRIGPVARIDRRTRRAAAGWIAGVQGLIEDMMDAQSAQSRSEIAVTAEKAVQNIAGIATDASAALEMVVRLFSGTIGGVGGLLMQTAGGITEVTAAAGELHGVDEAIRTDAAAHNLLLAYLGTRPLAVVTAQQPEFYQLPEYFAPLALSAVVVARVSPDTVLIVLCDGRFQMEAFESEGAGRFQTIVENLHVLTLQQATQQQFTHAYTRVLKQLAGVADNLNPYTVGYSEMMARYALVIGLELGLDEGEMHDLALAAHLSNIGVLGLSMDLLSKDTKYTDLEYETMKLHSEVGASMIQIATGNRRAAAWVLHHHERVDGNGYPQGLSGSEIPIGAKILAVVQVFLAKINGRKSRDPLPFDKALQALRAASGTQLDAVVVEAFIRWVEGRRGLPDVRGRSLGACWEMCATPESVCRTCPVYQRRDVNCWEVGNNHCQAHGRSCETCFVRTEYMARIHAADPLNGTSPTRVQPAPSTGR